MGKKPIRRLESKAKENQISKTQKSQTKVIVTEHLTGYKEKAKKRLRNLFSHIFTEVVYRIAI
jgi:hypothetical protein